MAAILFMPHHGKWDAYNKVYLHVINVLEVWEI